MPLSLDAHLPTEVTSGDEIRLPVTLTNETDDAIDADLEAKFGAAFQLAQNPAGKIHVAVEKSGSETATAKIAQILNDSAGYKLGLQHKGERLADKAVIPTLGLGGLAFATLGPPGAMAVINSDLGTGIRMAAPLAMLSTLALCAQKGVLVKDGRALDLLCEVDTVLFDKTGTLTRERPEVGRVIAANGFRPLQILRLAAGAERRFHHPVALAILQMHIGDGVLRFRQGRHDARIQPLQGDARNRAEVGAVAVLLARRQLALEMFQVRPLQAAAQQGAADAQNKLGAMYNDGLGVAQDQRKARDLFRQSAGQGYPPAMVNLGRMYTEAIGGERDEIRGFAWIQAAINVGVPASMTELAYFELGAATARLNRRQLARAQQMARQLPAAGSPAGEPSLPAPAEAARKLASR